MDPVDGPDGMTLGEMDGNAVRAENAVCSRRVEQREAGVRVVYEIRASEPGRVLVTDRLHGVDPDAFAFDPDQEPEQWAMQDETVAFKVPVEPGEPSTYVYGVKTDDPDDLLIRDPTIERVDEGSRDPGNGGSQNRGVLAGFGSLRSAVRRVSGDAGPADTVGGIGADGLDEAAVEDLESRIEEFERRLDSLEVERARQALEPMEERLAGLTEDVESLEDHVTSLEEYVGAVDERLEGFSEELAELDAADSSAPEGIEDLRSDLGDVRSGLEELERRSETLEATQERTIDRLDALEGSQAETRERLDALDARAEERSAALERVTERVEVVEREVQEVADAQEQVEDRLGAIAEGIERFEEMWEAMQAAMTEDQEPSTE